MPATPVVRPVRLTRRQGLSALALLGPVGLLAACSTSATPDSATTAAVTPSGSALPTDIGAQELALIAQYQSAIAAFPSLAAALTPLADQHRQHADALDVPGDAVPGPSPAAPPPTPADALAGLAAAERRAMRACIEACVAATDPGRARTLAFIAASEGSHVPALRAVRA